MSRIVALLHRDGRPAGLETIRRLVAPMGIRGSDAPRFRLSGRAALAYQCLQASAGPDDMQPAELGAALSICFDGRLDNREELISEFHSELTAEPASLPDAFFAMACYRRFGESFASKLNGDFALALFDSDRQQLVLARDVMGVRPLYFWLSDDTFIAASEIKAILEHPRVDPQPDDNALADLLIGGNPDEMRLTLFRGVSRVLPGCTVIVAPRARRELRHWDFDPARQIRCGSIAEYAEGLRERLAQSVRRRLRSPRAVATFVSGGLDSSAILGQAEILGKADPTLQRCQGISCLFPEGSPADERRYLEDIEALHGIDIVRIPPSPVRYSVDTAWVRAVEYPLFPRSTFLHCLQSARDQSCATVLEGYYGDQILWSRAHLFQLIRGFRWLEARREFHALSGSMQDCDPRDLRQELLKALFRGLAPAGALRLYRFARRLADRDSSRSCYSRLLRDLAYQRSQQQRGLDGPFASLHAEHCYKLAHARHVSFDMEISNHVASRFGMEMAYPFADRDLVAFVMAIPGEVVTWNGVYKGLFRESTRGILPESIRLRSWKADFIESENDAALALGGDGFEKYFEPESLAASRGYVDAAVLPDSLFRLKARLTGRSIWPIKQMNELLALEVWLKTFFGGTSPAESANGL